MSGYMVDQRVEVQCAGTFWAFAALQGIPPDPCGWFGSKHLFYGIPYCPICGGNVGEEHPANPRRLRAVQDRDAP